MAQPVLPNPDMDFTPLDVLTAADMDKIVANINYLKDYSGRVASGAEIADGSIEPAKLKLGAAQYKKIDQQRGISLPTNWQERDVPNSSFRASFVRGGVYRVTGYVSFLTNGGHQNGELTMKVNIGGKNVVDAFSGNGTIPSASRIAVGIYTADTTGDLEVKMRLQNHESRTVDFYTGYIFVERIA